MAAMSVDVQDRVMRLLREAADVLEQVTGQSIYMPGWDPEQLDHDQREQRVRMAAEAIHGTLMPDMAASVPVASLGCLVRYIADMLE